MDKQVQILLVIIGIIFLLYLTKPSLADCPRHTEGFDTPAPLGYYDINDRLNHHPDQTTMARSYYENIFADADVSEKVPSYYDNLDPETLIRLRRTILRTPDRTTRDEVAYNDLGVDRFVPGEIRPFNDIEARISEARADSIVEINDQYDSSFYNSWIASDAKDTAESEARAREIANLKLDCVGFNKVNQCMSKCADTPNCVGFNVTKSNPDGSGECCMMIEPPFAYERHSYDKEPNNLDYVSYRYLNNLSRRAAKQKDLPTFDRVSYQKDGTVYSIDVSRPKCKAFCPKCITGKCPDNYRCRDLQADPRYNESCLITNEDRYNEDIDNTFDDDSIPSLEERYGLNEYAGYDDLHMIPIEKMPPSFKLNLLNGLIPNKFDPDTWGAGSLADKQIKALEKAETASGQKAVEKETAKAFIKATKQANAEIKREENSDVKPVLAESFQQGYSPMEPSNSSRSSFKLMSQDKLFQRYADIQPSEFVGVQSNYNFIKPAMTEGFQQGYSINEPSNGSSNGRYGFSLLSQDKLFHQYANIQPGFVGVSQCRM